MSERPVDWVGLVSRLSILPVFEQGKSLCHCRTSLSLNGAVVAPTAQHARLVTGDTPVHALMHTCAHSVD